MNKKSAMSAMGYAIVSVIVLGIVMIISAPMLVTSVKEEKPQEPEPVRNYEREESGGENYSQLQDLERRLSSRIDELERRQGEGRNDKYVCDIEGKLDDNGEVVPVDNVDRFSKIVLVCEYRQ